MGDLNTPIIGTTQSYWGSPNADGTNVQFVSGRIKVVDIEFKNVATAEGGDDHKRWPGEVIGTGNLVEGVEYTVTAVNAADKNRDLTAIGGADFSQKTLADTFYTDLEVGYKFIASKNGAAGLNAATKLTFSSVSQAVGTVLQALGNMSTVIAVGKILPGSGANSFTSKDERGVDLSLKTGEAASNKFTVILENSSFEYESSLPTDELVEGRIRTWLNQALAKNGTANLTVSDERAFVVTTNTAFSQ